MLKEQKFIFIFSLILVHQQVIDCNHLSFKKTSTNLEQYFFFVKEKYIIHF